MYVYCPFSPHNGITTGNVLISLFSPINDNFNFSWNYYKCIAIAITETALFCILFVSYFCVLLRTRANFVIDLCAVMFART
jgi:hypothetical protein